MLNTTLTNNDMTIDNNAITIPATGTYIVSYQVGDATDVSGTERIAIGINGTINTPTQVSLSNTEATGGTFILNLNSNDTITLIPTITGTSTINTIGGYSATLTAVRIA